MRGRPGKKTRDGIGERYLDADVRCENSVNRDEVDRLRKRFMKLDKASGSPTALLRVHLCGEDVRTRSLTVSVQDNSGTLEREEFLSLPQVSTNPLATRCVSACLTATSFLIYTSHLLQLSTTTL